jgi:hypothetical protein
MEKLLCPGDSPANPIALPEKNGPPGTSAIFGLNVGECYADYDPGRHCLKTFQGSLFPTEGGSSTELCLTFTDAGMMRNGKLYRLRRSERSILENGSGLSAAQSMKGGLWRTPDANMERGNRSYENMKMRLEQGKPLNLNDQLNAISKGLLPTPRNNKRKCINSRHLSLDGFASLFPTPDVRGFTNEGFLKMLAEKAGSREEFFGMAYRAGKKKKETLWPTPTARDYKDGSSASCKNVPVNGLLGRAVHKGYFLTPRATDIGKGEKQETFLTRMGERTDACFQSLPAQIGGQLNPDWVEALMGYPQGWTDIEKDVVPQDTDFPAAWLDGTWEDGIPRTATGMKNRMNRLKCLGNAVVPQIPMMIWMMIKELL